MRAAALAAALGFVGGIFVLMVAVYLLEVTA